MKSSISIIGAGNLANSLVPALINAGFKIDFINSKSGISARDLASKYELKSTNNLSDLKSDIIVIATSDSAIEAISNKIQLNDNQIIVHTAGSISIEIIAKKHSNAAVLYPLQTFSKHTIVDLKNIPICIEASNKNTLTVIRDIAKLISNNVTELTSSQRLQLHAAAVFTNNFTNFMYTIGKDILTNHNIDFKLLHPLILETAQKALINNPQEIQTGPAVRNDINTISLHKQILSGEQLEMYELLTQWIKNRHADIDKA